MINRRFLRIKALKALYGHVTAEEESVIASQKKMLYSIGKSYELYHLMLQLIVDVRDYAVGVLELNRNKLLATEEDKNPNTRFVDNEVIRQLAEDEKLQSFLKKEGLSWAGYEDLMKKLYQQLAASEYYREYMGAETSGYMADKALVADFYRSEIEDNQALYDAAEDISIYWIDEIEFITSKVVKTVQDATLKNGIRLLPLYLAEEDKEYVKELFVKSLFRFDENVEIIRRYAKNWDVERITLMDRLIIVMAIAELNEFPSIPVKVTLDEYIEIAKYYSTQNSNVFINGILDRYASDLKAEGKLNKSGRGLLEA